MKSFRLVQKTPFILACEQAAATLLDRGHEVVLEPAEGVPGLWNVHMDDAIHLFDLSENQVLDVLHRESERA